MVRDGRRSTDRRRSQPGPTRRERTEAAPTQVATKSGWIGTGDQGGPRRQPRLRTAGVIRPTTATAPDPSGEAAGPRQHRPSATAPCAGVGHAVRCDTQLASSHVGEAKRYRQPRVQTACADLAKCPRAWRHRLVFGAIRGCLAQQVGRVFSRGSSEPRKRILACRCGLTVELSCGPAAPVRRHRHCTSC